MDLIVELIMLLNLPDVYVWKLFGVICFTQRYEAQKTVNIHIKAAVSYTHRKSYKWISHIESSFHLELKSFID